MFTIIISEKGGAERREAFDRNEINVGRVQGNDLMLAKGNVSKHHARLLYRDGRFIVTDLKSTNGTYVNGRKITQATIVREGDKIYVGDFVLRLETAQAAAAVEASAADSSAQGLPALSEPMLRDVVGAAGHALLGGSLDPVVPDSGSMSPQSRPVPALGIAGSAPSALRSADGEGANHFPIERDSDSESGPNHHGPPPVVVPPPRPADGRPRTSTAVLGIEGGVRRDSIASSRTGSQPRPTPRQAARRGALIALVDRVVDTIDASSLDASPAIPEAAAQEIEAAIRDQARAMRQDGEAPESVDVDQLVRDASREMVGLGPIGPLLEDAEIQEIHVARPDGVIAVRRGQSTIVEPGFTSELALGRVIARLAAGSGEPIRTGEAILDRSLARGERMTAVGPPVARCWTLTIRRAMRSEGSLQEQLRSGTLSRSIAGFLEGCVGVRANILVVGPSAVLVSPMVAALGSVFSPVERIAVLTDADQIVVPHAFAMPFALGNSASRDKETMQAATRLRPDRFIVVPLAGAVASATIDAIGEGAEGVIAGARAPSIRHALARISARVAFAHSGLLIESAREAVAESFDIAIEIVRAADGRPRVLRVTELAGVDRGGIAVRDLFVWSAEGTGEAGFVPTGAIPRVAHDFAARGIKLDPAIFKRR